MSDNTKALAAIDEALFWVEKRQAKVNGLKEAQEKEFKVVRRFVIDIDQEAIDTIKASLQAAKALLEDGGWNEDMSSAPKDGTEILARIPLGKSGKVITQIIWRAYKHGLGAWIYKLDQGFEIYPTHWKPLDSDSRALDLLSKIGGDDE